MLALDREQEIILAGLEPAQGEGVRSPCSNEQEDRKQQRQSRRPRHGENRWLLRQPPPQDRSLSQTLLTPSWRAVQLRSLLLQAKPTRRSMLASLCPQARHGRPVASQQWRGTRARTAISWVRQPNRWLMLTITSGGLRLPGARGAQPLVSP